MAFRKLPCLRCPKTRLEGRAGHCVTLDRPHLLWALFDGTELVCSHLKTGSLKLGVLKGLTFPLQEIAAHTSSLLLPQDLCMFYSLYLGSPLP